MIFFTSSRRAPARGGKWGKDGRSEVRGRRSERDLDYLLALDDASRIGAPRFRFEANCPFLAPASGQIPPLVRLNALLRATDAIHHEPESGRGRSLPKIAYPSEIERKETSVGRGSCQALILLRAANEAVPLHQNAPRTTVGPDDRVPSHGSETFAMPRANPFLFRSFDAPGQSQGSAGASPYQDLISQRGLDARGRRF